MATPIFNIDLLSFDTFILAVRTTDGKIIMKLDSEGDITTIGKFKIIQDMGYYDREKNEIILPETSEQLPELPKTPESNE